MAGSQEARRRMERKNEKKFDSDKNEEPVASDTPSKTELKADFTSNSKESTLEKEESSVEAGKAYALADLGAANVTLNLKHLEKHKVEATPVEMTLAS
eukprot:1688165-Amphidinium_carterae.1